MSHRCLTCEPGAAAVVHLARIDGRFARLAELIGPFSVMLKTDYYETLVRTIVGQQLSVKAAATIWGRVAAACVPFVPGTLLSLTDEMWRELGVSRGKAAYIRDLSGKVAGGAVKLDTLADLDDGEVIRLLTEVKGIGQWTAEMFLIFSLGRTDVLSLGDAGLQRAARWLFGSPDVNLRDRFAVWTPHCSVASLYLWEAINRGLVDGYASLELAESALRER